MKKSLMVISMMLVLAFTVLGCATKGDLEKVQSDQMQTGAKADQAAQDAQKAKAAADAATVKANEAAARAEKAVESAKAAEERAKAAEEKAKISEEKAKKDQELFNKSMKKQVMLCGAGNVALSALEREWQGFETLPLPYACTVQV